MMLLVEEKQEMKATTRVAFISCPTESSIAADLGAC
jgi:hypothetical protein